MDIRKVKKLIELLQESGISEIEVHEGEESVRISSHGHQASNAPQTLVQAHHPVVPQAVIPPTASGQEVPVVANEAPAVDEGKVITSPMVGIFYSSSSPDTSPFVEIGQAVKQGDVLCIIEAMKIMNQIESDTDGVISKIFVENGEPIEYGQPLFAIK